MIQDVKYSVTFPTNGISLSGAVSFEPGITAIIGDNGNGKTFGSIEMIRYMLFGKAALRGPASDYKTLDAVMTFTIRGAAYTVERNRKFERLIDAEDTALAVGAEAVTKRIVELLGFGLDVFDVVCASVQKESDKLTKMKPAERKRLIDQVIGLSSNEAVEKACRNEATALRRDADVLQDNLVPVEAPVRPAAYRKSSEIKAELVAVEALIERRRGLGAVINGVGPKPDEVEQPEGDLYALVEHEDERRRHEAEIAHAKQELAKIPEATLTAEHLDASQALLDWYAEQQRRGAQPTIGRDAAQAVIDEWAHHALLTKIGDTEVQCPECDHKFRPGVDLPTVPGLPLDVARDQLRANEMWATHLPKPECDLPLTSSQIDAGRLALSRAADRAAAEGVARQPRMEDRSAELNALRHEWARYEAYLAQLARYSEASLAATEAQAELDKLPLPTADVAALNDAFVQARIYETQLDNFVKAKQAYDDTVAGIAAKGEKANAFKKGAEALVKARQSVKAYLAPSLSRVSSALIHQMSGGVLSNMIVDEDMNITVDGQEIGTLSGAGSTVANLSLRLALGQVLVRNIFPIFIADEADADLSDSRAQFTAECMGNLKGQLDQIIVITHKEVTVADHVISR